MALRDVVEQLRAVRAEGPAALAIVESIGEATTRINREAVEVARNIDRVRRDPFSVLTPQQAAALQAPQQLFGPGGQPLPIGTGGGGSGGGRLGQTTVEVEPDGTIRIGAGGGGGGRSLVNLGGPFGALTMADRARLAQLGAGGFALPLPSQTAPSVGERGIIAAVNQLGDRLLGAIAGDGGASFRARGGL